MRVRTYYLEMKNPEALCPSASDTPGFEIRKVVPPSPELNRYLYQGVGFPWRWVDRLSWTLDDWQRWVDRPEFQTWIGWLGDVMVGYFELVIDDRRDVEIASFGLFASYTGKGLGGLLLTDAVQRAWAMRGKRVWLHTCTLDHPRALQNYQTRGFRIFREESDDLNVAPLSERE